LKAFGSKADAEAMKAGLKDLGKSCKSCHKKFKSKEYQGS
jgi:cytochrome c556